MMHTVATSRGALKAYWSKRRVLSGPTNLGSPEVEGEKRHGSNSDG
jgi:hypothetical protein